MKSVNGHHSGNGKQSEDGWSRFKRLTANLVAVPKKEVEQKEAEYKRRKARKKRKNAT